MAVIPQCLSRIPCSSSLSAKVFHANSSWSGLQQFKLALQHSITTTHTSLRRSKVMQMGKKAAAVDITLLNLQRHGQSQRTFTSNTSQEDFASVLQSAKKVVVLTGAGISAESGIPTFRGEGGLWRSFDATELATPSAFAANPSLVWEFYHYRRNVVAGAAPNLGHYAIAALQRRCQNQDKQFTLLTQNIDGLHVKAGSTDVVELHGSMWKTRCCNCSVVQTNRDMPICAALEGKGAPDTMKEANIPRMQLPRCEHCNGLLRPHVVWFGESLDPTIMERTDAALEKCDLLLVIGTSAVVYPAAGFAPMVKAHGGVVAEFNIEDTPVSYNCRFKFHGPSSMTLPSALGIQEEEMVQFKQS